MVHLAYIDPGSGSLLLQALIGGLSGLIVFANYIWQRFKFGSRKPKE